MFFKIPVLFLSEAESKLVLKTIGLKCRTTTLNSV